MSRGKRGTCNYRMMSFRVHKDNWSWLEHKKKQGFEKGVLINELLDLERCTDSTYKEPEDPRQKYLEFD